MGLIKLDYICFLNSSGYSQAAQNYIKALHNTGECDIKITVFGKKPDRSIGDEDYEFFINMSKKEEDPDRILIYHCIPNIQRRVKKNKRSIGFGVFETFQPPESWNAILNTNDAIIVPSQFNYKIFSHASIEKPIYYIPHCINLDLYNNRVVSMYDYDRYTFLFMGTWRERKGYKQLLEAWIREFKESDRVQLVVKTDKPQQAERYLQKLTQQLGINKGFAPIIFENKVFDEKDLPRFIKSSDCLISPTLGEGFGYPGLQCLSMGIPLIITDHSGCKDYANNETSVLIEPSSFIIKKDMDNIPQFRNRKWAFVEVDKIRKSMRYVFENPNDASLRARAGNNYVNRRFSYDVVGKMFIDMLREIYD